MTIEQAIEHGRRWLAAGWTWKRGQVALAEDDDGEWRTLVVTGTTASGHPQCYGVAMPSSAVPDPRDPGTRGHMLEQVREAWDEPTMSTEFVSSRRSGGPPEWLLCPDDANAPCWGQTEAEALLAARESAPGMKPTPPG